jgi:NAD(P)-dependent dehydrogenase (short-subunit alcohol dehydrogenase family)
MRFDDKVFIVSGGASGMGRATATLLAESGADVVIADIDVDAGARVAESIGARAVLDETDLRSVDAIESLVARTEERFGRIDGLANVAAVYPFLPFMDTTPGAWQEIDEVNHRAVFFLTQAVARTMIRNGGGGAIVNIASGAAFWPVPGMTAYSGTKGGVVSMSRTMAHELAPHGIRVNVVAPGHTLSETALRHLTPELQDQIASTLVGGRWLQPEEIAQAIVFLLGDGARGMTGAVVNVNQGNYMPH